MFGGFQPPTPVDRTKFDTEKSRPSVPERPAIIKLHGSNSVTNFNPNWICNFLFFVIWKTGPAPATTSSTNLAPEAQSPNESKGQGPAVLERVHSFSVNRQQVSIVQVNSGSNNSTLTLNSSDHPDIQYADSEEAAQSTTAAHGNFA